MCKDEVHRGKDRYWKLQAAMKGKCLCHLAKYGQSLNLAVKPEFVHVLKVWTCFVVNTATSLEEGDDASDAISAAVGVTLFVRSRAQEKIATAVFIAAVSARAALALAAFEEVFGTGR